MGFFFDFSHTEENAFELTEKSVSFRRNSWHIHVIHTSKNKVNHELRFRYPVKR